jgi:hypothetical protein
MKKITKRDLSFFLLGILSLFLIDAIYDWEGTVNAFINGFNDGYNSAKK